MTEFAAGASRVALVAAVSGFHGAANRHVLFSRLSAAGVGQPVCAYGQLTVTVAAYADGARRRVCARARERARALSCARARSTARARVRARAYAARARSHAHSLARSPLPALARSLACTKVRAEHARRHRDTPRRALRRAATLRSATRRDRRARADAKAAHAALSRTARTAGDPLLAGFMTPHARAVEVARNSFNLTWGGAYLGPGVLLPAATLAACPHLIPAALHTPSTTSPSRLRASTTTQLQLLVVQTMRASNAAPEVCTTTARSAHTRASFALR